MAKTLPSNIAFTMGSQDYSADEDLELVTSDTTPGGYDSLSCQLCNYKNRLPNLGERALVYNKALNKTVWLGRVEDVSPVTSGRPISIQARGLGFVGTTDRRMLGTIAEGPIVNIGTPGPVIYTAGMTVEQVIASALSFCSDIYDDGIIASGLQLDADSPNFALQTPQDVLNFATALTSGVVTPLLWWVRESRNSPVIAGLTTAFMDNSSRYEVALQHNEKEYIESSYNLQGFINKAMVGWGKNGEQFEVTPTPLDYSATGRGLERDKAVNASNAVRNRAAASSLANNYLSRFSAFRAIQDTIVICESLVTAKPPLYSRPTSVPAYMVRSGNGINVSNMPDGLGRYNQGQKYVVRAETNWSSGITTLSGGEIISLDSAIQLIESFNVNRLFNGTQLSTASWPLVDQDTAPVYGPAFDSAHNFSAGIPIFVLDKNGLPFKAVVHPGLIADEGIEVNFAFDVTTAGFKGGTWSIPGKYKEVKVEAFLSTAANGVIEDNFTLVIWHKIGGAPPNPIGPPIIINTDKNGECLRTIQEFSTSDRKGMFIFQITSPAATAENCTVSLHGVKLYPGLRL